MPSLSNKRKIATLSLSAFGLAYPFLVYFGIGYLPPGAFVLMAITLVVVRISLAKGFGAGRPFVPALLVVSLTMAGVAVFDKTIAMTLYPMLMNLAIAVAFGFSLWFPPTLVEALASIRDPNPSPAASRYMRKVTRVWFGFLLCNTAISGATIWLGDIKIWTLYNGLISYLLMGVLAGGEYLIRRRIECRDQNG